MDPKEHTADCRWEKTTAAECEYRETHYYCPHREHECTCPPPPPQVDCPHCKGTGKVPA